MADEAFSLKDAIALYSGKIDLSPCAAGRGGILRLRAATCARARTSKRCAPPLPSTSLRAGSMTPWRDVRCTQGEAVKIEAAINRYRTAYEKKEIKEELRPVLDTFRPWLPKRVGKTHLLIDVVVVGAIVVKLFVQLRVHHMLVGWGELW